MCKKKQLQEPVEILDSFFQEAPAEAKPLWFLGKSLEVLSEADLAAFAPGWETARGCKIEHQCAKEYGIGCLELAEKQKPMKPEMGNMTTICPECAAHWKRYYEYCPDCGQKIAWEDRRTPND